MLTTITSAFLLTVAGYLFALKLFPAIGLLDFPERYGLTRTRLPYPAGCIAILVFVIVFATIDHDITKQIGVLAAIVILGVVSFLDDRSPLPSWVRLMSQITVAVLVFIAGARIYTITSPMGGILKLDEWILTLGSYGSFPILGGIFSVLWILLTINAMNWFDGVPGQVHVISTIGFVMIGCLAYFRNGETTVTEIAFVLASISAAGLLFDFPPHRMLIGDTGAMFFGFMLGVLGIYEGGKVATAFLAVGLPLIDAAIVIVRRLMKRQSPFQGGRDHLHHLLLDRGWHPRAIILLTACIGALFGVTALFLGTTEKGIALILLALFILGLIRYASRPLAKNR
ncbi:MAG: MraY family glycosyltransferase [Candidatus Peribacteraceae bacterium]